MPAVLVLDVGVGEVLGDGADVVVDVEVGAAVGVEVGVLVVLVLGDGLVVTVVVGVGVGVTDGDGLVTVVEAVEVSVASSAWKACPAVKLEPMTSYCSVVPLDWAVIDVVTWCQAVSCSVMPAVDLFSIEPPDISRSRNTNRTLTLVDRTQTPAL